MRRIVFLDRATLAPHIRLRRPALAHDWIEYERTSAAEAGARLAEAEIAINNKVRIDAATLDQAPRLKLIALAATGSDCIDKEACKARGVNLCNIRDYAGASVPEHAFALLLALRRRLIDYRARVLAGEWARSGQFCFFNGPIKDLAGSRLGLVGSGSLGSRMAAIGRGFGMDVVFAARKGAAPGPDRVGFEEMLETSDAISLHCPLTPETRGLIGAAEFALMKRRPILINTARGGLVDEAALEAALEAGHIAGAGFDVASLEPAPDDHPMIRLAARPDVILTPHTAWASDGAQQTLADQLIGNIEAWAAGSPRNLLV